MELAEAKKDLEDRVEKRTRELQRRNQDFSEEIARSTRLEGLLLESSERERRRFGQDTARVPSAAD
jgi:C4-dicarboxylate-specific signal transduction histidine kinase